jgi:diguanylate cyclase (GGDEF)-like protein
MAASIRTKLIAGLCLGGLLFALALLPLANYFLESNFAAFERQEIARDTRQLQLVINERMETQRQIAHDWGHWDIAREHVLTKNKSFLDDNMSIDTMNNFDSDLLLIFNTEQFIVSATAQPRLFGKDSNQLLEMNEESLRTLLKPIREQLKSLNGLSGATLFFIDQTPYLMGWSEITDNEVKQPSVGKLVFLRRMDSSAVENLRKRTEVNFDFHPCMDNCDEQVYSLKEKNRAEIAKHILIYDTRQKAVGMMDVYAKPRLQKQLNLARSLMIFTLLLTVGCGILLSYWILNRVVVRRISGLNNWMSEKLYLQGRADQADILVQENDEIDQLHGGFNELMQNLDQATKRWKSEAQHDWLTGLGNRASLITDIERHYAESATEKGLRISVLLIDLDNFKAINDLLGHAAGDDLLREVAHVLRSQLPPEASPYRLGGDEFAVLWPGHFEQQELEQLAELLCASLRINRSGNIVSASIGIVSNDKGKLPLSELLMRADIALYSAKEKGRDVYAFFDSGDLNRFRERYAMERLLFDALSDQQIEVHFQPIVNARSGKVRAVEALARWHHPERGSISPARFIAVAERTQIIEVLDAYVLRRSSESLLRLREQFPNLRMNINVSPQTLNGDKFFPELDRLLASGLPSNAFQLEITENNLVGGNILLEHAVERLRQRNIGVVIDDFGVGASSLNRLARVRAMGLKLDGSFISDYRGDGGRICRAIVELSRELQMAMTAEFVEDAAQVAFLLDIGCDHMQGYHFSPALPEQQCASWIFQFEQRSIAVQDNL